MSRPRSIPDAEVLGHVRALIAAGGGKSVTFSAVSRAAGLAGSSLVQRYGDRDAMVRAALADGWAVLMARTEEAAATAPRTAKGGADFLKLVAKAEDNLLSVLVPRQRAPELRDLAEAWRARMEAELALRVATDEKKPARQREAAAVAFAAWLGRLMWEGAGPGGETGLKLKAIVRQVG
ncbi:transcriptional regulator [Acidimangrovimonas sediminis]|uniref:transcriptional regulator n=1 Tax=Acidimangrovimonas sediminis TaxID=2056283 RepID=UPI0011AF3B1B|nr:transcriptional regulator [Acidimangrovimonas sediminis]